MGYDSQNSGGSRIGGRLIMALIIALFGFFMYMSHTEENPITGEKQHIAISPEQEIKLGIQSAPEMAAEMGGEVPSNDPRAIEVQKIGNEIVSRSEAHKGPWQFHFHLLADPKTVNAFALPGGQIFITIGLLDLLQTEAQLAGVLGHEAGHVIQRHSAQQMAKSKLGQILVAATGVGLSDPNNPNRGREAAVIAGIVNQTIQLKYSRNDELEADQWGLLLMSQAGYTPKAMLEVMDILEKASPGGHKPEMLLTHPYPENRKKQINEYLEKHPPSSNLTEGANLRDVFKKSSLGNESYL